jgi:DNA repair exonuclease SbcCD ATPase subunit
LEADDYKVHKQSLDLLAELYSQMGDSSLAYAMQRRSKEFTDSLEQANKTSLMADWQMKFDEQQRENRYLRMANWLLGIIISLILISIIVWWWHRQRVRRLRFRLDENIRQITQYQKEIDRLEQSGEAHMQEISQLKEQITQRRERISAKLLTGANLFNQIKDKLSLAGISATDLQSLVDYFAQLRPKRWQEWESQYKELTTAQYIFLILQDDLRYDDETIATILDLKRPSVRSMRSRIKGKVM